MKKVYTVTFHKANNYGAIIQAYALQQFLLKNNFDTVLLNYDNHNLYDNYNLFVRTKGNFNKTIKNYLKSFFVYKKKKDRIANFERFRKRLKMTDYFDNPKDVEKIIDPNSIFIVGSDQVWNSKLEGGIDDIFTLNFGGDTISRISYAASSGNLNNFIEEENEYKKRLDVFNKISVREEPLKNCLSKLLDKDIEVVLDPSLLLTKADWINFSGKERILKEKYIFAYDVGNPNKIYYEVINKLAKKTGLKVVYFGSNYFNHNLKCKKMSFYTSGPIEWMNLLANAEYVITTSFHGTALSVMLNKNMFVILSTIPDRILTLLDNANLNDRIITSIDDFDKVYNLKIDWNKVNYLIDKLRTKSSKWLLNAIESVSDE